jgi:N4-(beta-N-acetylglucosaminyl)-L-asparaginase
MNRRAFVAVAGVGALGGPTLLKAAGAPAVLIPKTVRPVVLSAANGNISKDAQGLTCVARAFRMITAGADVLDAAVAGVSIVELDPEDTSVGYGGLPNADGVVQLDASVMHGPRKQAGAVACLEGVRTASFVAKKVMEETDNHLLVGRGAQEFARNMGFEIERDLNTPKSRKLWLEWKRRTDPEHYPNPKDRREAWYRAGRSMVADGLIEPDHFYGTINCNVINAAGDIGGATTTSGLAWKIPGRVGDSPILGAGLYVDGAVGAAGSTGRGEANLFSLGSFLVVEGMRNGMSPKDAGIAALKRVVANTVEKRLLDSRGRPNFHLVYYMLNARGEYAVTSMYELSGKKPMRFAVCTDDHPRTETAEALFEGAPAE